MILRKRRSISENSLDLDGEEELKEDYDPFALFKEEVSSPNQLIRAEDPDQKLKNFLKNFTPETQAPMLNLKIMPQGSLKNRFVPVDFQFLNESS